MEKVIEIKRDNGKLRPQVDCIKDGKKVSLFKQCINCPHWGGFLVDKIRCQLPHKQQFPNLYERLAKV